MLTWLKKWLGKKPKPPRHPGQVVTGQWRLIPLVDFSRSRKVQRALLAMKGLDPQSRDVLQSMQYMTDDEFRPPRKRWCDPD